MKKLTNFNDYLINKILEDMDLKVRELELVLSPRMIKILKEVNHVISDTLLETHIDDKQDYKITFIDLGTEADLVSFIQSNKVPELIEPELVHGDYKRELTDKEWTGGHFDYVPSYKNPWVKDSDHISDLLDPQFKSKDHQIWHKNRAEMKIGRFISKIFPNMFPANKKREDLATSEKPNDVESFVNMFIATVESNSKIIKIVSGEEIRHYYSNVNSFKAGGTLGGSCMNHPDRGRYLDLYVKNPEKIQMLVLYPEDVRDKIIGRALLWKLDTPSGDRYYMDRVYTANDSDQYMFIEYAKKQGWLYKSSQTYGWEVEIIDGKDDSRKMMTLGVKLNKVDYDFYPYADTMQFYNGETGEINNNRNSIKSDDRSKYKVLTSTDGSYGRV
jgi:hypothetical protein